jgi:hypothetical protein
VSDWKLAVLRELKARSVQSAAIMRLAGEKLGFPVLVPSPERSFMYPGLVSLIRRTVTAERLGKPERDITEDVEWQGKTLFLKSAGEKLLFALEPGDDLLERLRRTVAAAKSLPETAAAVEARKAVERATQRAHEHCDSYLLLHHIPGRCSLCKKLGGQ